jgi:V/A-type H+-transporting ATPase subunit I
MQSILSYASQTLSMAAPLVEVGGAARTSSHIAVISGWIPLKNIDKLKAILQQQNSSPYFMKFRQPTQQERKQVPSLMVHSRWLSPFSALVRQYGIPEYDEIDPTVLFAFTYILMFGMMFGDIGHGLVIVLAGWLLRKRLNHYIYFVLAAGISSVAFGFLYGSIFGYEHLIAPIWISPLTNPEYMLNVALLWGILFVVLCNSLNIINQLIRGIWQDALLNNNSVTTLTLYLGLVAAGYQLFVYQTITMVTVMLIVMSLLLFTGYKWYVSSGSNIEKTMIALVESFEVIMGLISNTLSFLRVAAFSLNHVALALAVLALANMLDTTGHWLMVIGGNLFILILEGAIVTIQALRLEYFEGFSRFYSGNGHTFSPLTIQRGTTATTVNN